MKKEPAFTPWGPNLSKRITITASAAETKISDREGDFDVYIYNADTQDCFIEFGATGAITASVSTSMALPPGSLQVLHVPPQEAATYVSVIAAAANSRYLYITPGQGI